MSEPTMVHCVDGISWLIIRPFSCAHWYFWQTWHAEIVSCICLLIPEKKNCFTNSELTFSDTLMTSVKFGHNVALHFFRDPNAISFHDQTVSNCKFFPIAQ